MTRLWSVLLMLGMQAQLFACIWDGDTLSHEKHRNHTLAVAILEPTREPIDTNALNARIAELKQKPRKTDPNWWNNLAGAYLRLDRPMDAVSLLAPVEARFDTNYGIHANLGTAYHLMGDYVRAEKEIGRDLQIDPEAHFGLEKYHLALLQYLTNSIDYRMRHLYVDEFSTTFLDATQRSTMPSFYYHGDDWRSVPKESTNGEEAYLLFSSAYPTNHDERREHVRKMTWTAGADHLPPYHLKWDLAADTNLQDGVIYMADMNPQEPAVFEMLGVLAFKGRNYNLAATAFEKAIALGSLKQQSLTVSARDLRQHVRHSLAVRHFEFDFKPYLVPFSIGLLALAGMLQAVKALRVKARTEGQKSSTTV